MPTCYIVGAGDFTPRGFAPVPGDLVLAADGGYRALYSLGYTPDLLLGDFDSLGDLPLPPDLPVLRFPARKDDTDTGLALRHGLDRGKGAGFAAVGTWHPADFLPGLSRRINRARGLYPFGNG